jgi:hypothetical protein
MVLRYDAGHSVTFLDNHDTAGELKDRFGTLDQVSFPPVMGPFSSYNRSLFLL